MLMFRKYKVYAVPLRLKGMSLIFQVFDHKPKYERIKTDAGATRKV